MSAAPGRPKHARTAAAAAAAATPVGSTTEQIAAQMQHCDPLDMHVADVTAFLQRLVQPVAESEDVAIADAQGRVLAQALVSPLNVPPHDNAAMDGYAFDGAQLQPGLPLTLRCVGTVLAGQLWHDALEPGEALRIMTGAAMPAGLDTVVPQELVSDPGDGIVVVPADALKRHANRRLAGEDLRQGHPALPAGQLLGPAALGLIASLGLSRITVYRKLRVAYFSTGNEIQSLGEAPRAGAVYDSNRYTVTAVLRRIGVEVIDMGVVPDDSALLEAAFRSAAAQADAIVSSGGVSAGEADHTRAMMHKLSERSGGIVFWRVAMRPGRPMAVGRIGSEARSAVLFGLPGNPVAVMVSFLAFVRPALLRMMGCNADATPVPLRARLVHAVPGKKAGRTEYLRGIVSVGTDGALQVATTGNQGSGILSSMAQANGLIVLPHAQGPVASGTAVDVLMFDGWL